MNCSKFWHLYLFVLAYLPNVIIPFCWWLHHKGMILLNATDFALPQRRTRLFIIGINKERANEELANSPDQVLDAALTKYLPLFKTAPPRVES